jgi:hypothetical protein
MKWPSFPEFAKYAKILKNSMAPRTISTNPLARLLLIDCWRSIVFDNLGPGAQRHGFNSQIISAIPLCKMHTCKETWRRIQEKGLLLGQLKTIDILLADMRLTPSIPPIKDGIMARQVIMAIAFIRCSFHMILC